MILLTPEMTDNKEEVLDSANSIGITVRNLHNTLYKILVQPV